MRYFRKLVGQKCYLSPLNVDDVEKYVAWFNDLEVTRHFVLSYSPISLSNEREFLEKLAKEEHVYGIVDTETDELLGNVGFRNVDDRNRRAEIGIFIGDKNYWAKGYGEEAMRLLLGLGFDYLNLHSVVLNVYAFNQRAIACYRKLGFKEAGLKRDALRREGAYHDIVMMDLLEEEFRARRA